MDNPYEILSVAPTVTAKEIVRAYRKQCWTHHPDRNGGSADANARMRRINAAYNSLKTPAARAKTDATLLLHVMPKIPDTLVGTVELYTRGAPQNVRLGWGLAAGV